MPTPVQQSPETGEPQHVMRTENVGLDPFHGRTVGENERSFAQYSYPIQPTESSSQRSGEATETPLFSSALQQVKGFFSGGSHEHESEKKNAADVVQKMSSETMNRTAKRRSGVADDGQPGPLHASEDTLETNELLDRGTANIPRELKPLAGATSFGTSATKISEDQVGDDWVAKKARSFLFR